MNREMTRNDIRSILFFQLTHLLPYFLSILHYLQRSYDHLLTAMPPSYY